MINVGIIGYGYWGPNVARNFNSCEGTKLVSICDLNKKRLDLAKSTYPFIREYTDPKDLTNSDDIDVVAVVMPVFTHYELAKQALEKGKHIFVEKPLALTIEELGEIKSVYEKVKGSARLLVGFNRRFAPHIHQVKELLRVDSPKAINYRINAGAIPADHWVHDKDIGGGRIIGEVCHFVDLAMCISDSKITAVSAHAMRKSDNLLSDITGTCI